MAFQRIRIKNTNVAGKVPGADKLDTAELCINLQDQKLYSKDANGNVFELGKSGDTPSGGSGDRPASPEVGDIYWDTTLETLLIWNGSEWVVVGGVTSVNGETGEVVLDLGDLNDVDTTGVANGSILMWNQADSKWEVSDTSALDSLWVESGNALSPKTVTNQVLVGTSSSPSSGSGQYSPLVVQGYVGGAPGVGSMSLQRGEAATDIDDNDPIGVLNFNDNSGNTFARLRASADGTPGASSYPGFLEFHTTANGSDTPTERLRIDSAGDATFAGVGTFGPYDAGLASGTGVQANSGGALRVQRGSSASATAPIFEGYYGTTDTSVIRADGSATFAGGINGNSYYGYYNGDTSNSSSMRFNARARDVGGDFQLYDNTGTSNRTIYLDGSDGSATFAGDLNQGESWDRTANQRSVLITGGAVYAQRNSTDGTNPVFRGTLSTTDSSDAAVTSEIKADGSAMFAGDINIRTVVGSTISDSYTEPLKFAGVQDSGVGASLAHIKAQGKLNWGGDLVFLTKSADGNNSGTPEERLRIDSAGNITATGTITAGGYSFANLQEL